MRQAEELVRYLSHRMKKPLLRTDLIGVKLDFYRQYVELLRKLTPEQRLRMTFDRMEFSRTMREAGRKYDARTRGS